MTVNKRLGDAKPWCFSIGGLQKQFWGPSVEKHQKAVALVKGCLMADVMRKFIFCHSFVHLWPVYQGYSPN